MFDVAEFAMRRALLAALVVMVSFACASARAADLPAPVEALSASEPVATIQPPDTSRLPLYHTSFGQNYSQTNDEDSVAAERALLDYGEALRELARIDVFPGDLLLKNFGVTSQGKVVFYDYDEVTSLRECNFRELPVASNEEEEMSAEPWFFVGPNDVFPEQWLPFLGIPPELLDSFKEKHGELLGPRWWRNRQSEAAH